MGVSCLVTAFFVLLSAVCGIHGEIELSFSAEEEVSERQLLGNIIIEVNKTYQTDLQGGSFSISPSQYSNLFHIDVSGDLFLNRTVDREILCSSSQTTTCTKRIEIIAIPESGTNYQSVFADITIVDKNDNEPRFSRSLLNLEIPEGTSMGTSYELPSASDPDFGNNSIQNFILLPADYKFGLESFPKLDGTFSLNLILNLSLDRETKESYQLSVLAIDGGAQPKTGTLTVNIVVTDINDNRPVFNPETYNTTIDEDISPGNEIVTVTATDRDIGENARLSYSIMKMEPPEISSLIYIEEATGKIYLLEKLNTQTGPFTLYIEAMDHGEPVKRSRQAVVKIYVRDINNNVPNISINTLNGNKPFAKVKENSEIETLVALVNVWDADTGENGEAVCTCENSNFSINDGTSPNRFTIHVASSFDREVLDRYEVVINCTDKGVPPLSTTEKFEVVVEDENDNIPRFSMSEYTVNITENNNAGAVILRVTATDEDAGDNAKITYSIIASSDNMEKFYINSSTGIIQAKIPIDREVNDSFRFTVKAADNGASPEFDLATVTVNVEDLNDNPPVFTGDSYAMSVLENANISTSIGQVTASDIDKGVNGQVSFMIPAEFRSYPFDVLDDGTVVTTALLNREKVGLYSFDIVASDHGNPAQSSRVPVHVSILDINDNPPLLEFPFGDNDTVSVPNNAAPNTIVATVIAEDADEGKNRELTYSIIAGNELELFSINSNNGEIALTRQVSDGDIKQFTLTISVKDNGDNQLETRGTLHVSIFKAADQTGVAEGGSNGQNILIVIIMICVTFVLSLVIIIVICRIKRSDKNKSKLYSHNTKPFDQQKIIPDPIRNSNRSSSSRSSGDQMLFSKETPYLENGYPKKARNKVSFSMDEDQDTGISLETSGDQFDAVSTFKSPSPAPNQSVDYENYQREETPSVKNEESKPGDILRMASLRVHQAMIQSNYNNNTSNNNNKQWQQSTQEEHLGRGFTGLTRKTHLDDSHSESSGETTTSDSGRGGSEEDIRSNMTNSHDTDESRSPNTSSSHPFYTADNQHLSFKSFHGNNSHKSGPILSSFLKKKQNRQHIEDRHTPHYPLNDLSNPHRNTVHNSYSPYTTLSDTGASPRNMESQFGSQGVNSFGKVNNISDHPMNSYGSSNSGLSDHHLNSFGKVNNSLNDHVPLSSLKSLQGHAGTSYEDSVAGMSQDDDNTTTTSGSFTIPDLHEDMLASDGKDMFYKPDTFV